MPLLRYRSFRLIMLTGLLSFAAAALYGFGGLFSFRFLGPEAGSERGSVALWASVSAALGAVLCLGALLPAGRLNAAAPLVRAMFAVLTLTVFVQSLPGMLWLLVLLIEPADGLRGAAVHGLLTLSAVASVWALRKQIVLRSGAADSHP